MNPEDIELLSAKTGIPIARSKQSSDSILAWSNPTYSTFDKNTEYVAKAKESLNSIMNIGGGVPSLSVHPASAEAFNFKGNQMFPFLQSSYNSGSQKAIEMIKEFNKSKNYFVFDIETFGDAMKRKDPYSLTEIAINKYNKKGKLIKEGMNVLIRPDDTVMNNLGELLVKLQSDPYALNELTDNQRRAVVDLMRYSTKKDGGLAVFNKTKGIHHHSIVQTEFTKNENIVYDKFFEDPKRYLGHMKSGLETFNNVQDTQQKTAATLFKFMQDHKKELFVSYNGDEFDIKVMDDFMRKHTGKSVVPDRHLDMLQAVKTFYADPSKALPHLTGEPDGKKIIGHKLQSFAPYLNEEMTKIHGAQNLAHNAIADTHLTALVATKLAEPMEIIANKSLTPIPEGYDLAKSTLRWNDTPLKIGDPLTVTKAYRASKGRDDLSFVASPKENGEGYTVDTYGKNRYVTNSRSQYQFNGIIDMSDDSSQKLALNLFNPETNEHSYIIRQGTNAFSELTSMVQAHFTPMPIDPQLQKRYLLEGENDRARRTYDRFFSMNNAGAGLHLKDGQLVEQGGSGFVGAKRMYSAGAVYKEWIGEKDSARKERAREMVAQGLYVTEEEALNAHPRSITKVQMEARIKDLIPKEKERNHFWKMNGRLADESEYYLQAINEIEEKYAGDIDAAVKANDGNAIKKINQQRDYALMQYHQSVLEETENVGGNKRNIKIGPIHDRTLQVEDLRTGKERKLNFRDYDSARSGLYNFVSSGLKDNPHKEQLKKERLLQFVQQLASKETRAIGPQQVERYTKMIQDEASSWQAASLLSEDLMKTKSVQISNIVEVQNIHENINIATAIKSKERNQELIGRAIELETQSKLSMRYNESFKEWDIKLPKDMEEALSGLNNQTAEHLKPNNQKAVERVLQSIKQNGSDKHISLRYNGADNPSVDFFVYDYEHSGTVLDQLAKSEVPANAVHVNLPLIGKSGMIQYGSVISNAHMVVTNDKNGLGLRSTSEEIAESLSRKMSSILGSAEKEGVAAGSDEARKAVRKSVEHLSGSNRNASYQMNDTMMAKFNSSDYIKQNHYRIDNAMIQDLLASEFNGIRLDEKKDLRDSAYYTDRETGERRIKNNLSLDDVSQQAGYNLRANAIPWFNDRFQDAGLFSFASGVKSDKQGIYVSGIDMREMMPFGNLRDMSRDNAVQFQNLFRYEDKVLEDIKGVSGVNTNINIMTDRQLELFKQNGNSHLINGNFAIMTEEMLQRRIIDLAADSSNHELMKSANWLDKNGKIDWLSIPSLHEQQGVLASELKGKLKTNQTKLYSGGKSFAMTTGLEVGSIVKPGDLIGTRTLENGLTERVRYENKIPGTIQEILEGRDIRVGWQEDPFKFMMSGEKMTAESVPQALLKMITGFDDTIGIFNPDVKKHKDFDMLIYGRSALLTEAVGNEGNKKTKRSMINAIHKADIGLQWDKENQLFLDRTRELGLKPGGSLDSIANGLDDLFKNELFKDTVVGTSSFNDGLMTIEKYQMQLGMAGVADYSHQTDATGRRVLSRTVVDGVEDVRYAEGRAGVTLGAREMRLFQSLGMPKTYEHVLQQMKDQDQAQDAFSKVEGVAKKAITRSDEAKNLLHFMESFDKSNVDEPVFSHTDFAPLPKENRSPELYKGTIFDHEHMMSQSRNQHGFWMKLPTLEGEDGQVEKKIQIKGKNGRRDIDKIFIPFTEHGVHKGEEFLNDLQSENRKIYEKAKQVDEAQNRGERRVAMEELERAVNSSIEKGKYHLTSSKGLVGEGLMKADMPTSASGLYKVIDPLRSEAIKAERGIQGEFTSINRNVAKTLGVLEQLERGEKVRAGHLRYPTFHQGAMQFNQLVLDDSVKDNEFRVSSFASELKNADSDGDYGHLFVAKDADVQREWAQQDSNRKETFANRLAKYESSINDMKAYVEDLRGDGGASLRQMIGAESFKQLLTNSPEEIAAKIGKATIGQASNLNYVLQQVASDQFADGSIEQKQLFEFGRGIEQKIIDSKHGASSAGLDMIQAIYKGDWNRVKEIDTQSYDGLFSNKEKGFYLDDVINFLPEKVNNYEGGLRAVGFDAGKSSGLGADVLPQDVADMINGKADTWNKQSSGNAFMNLQRDLLGIEAENRASVQPMFSDEQTLNFRERKLKDTRNVVEKARNGLGDFGSSAMNNVSEVIEKVKNTGSIKAGIIGGALALGGISAYTMLSSKNPERLELPESPPEESTKPKRQQAAPQDTSSTQGADIEISAKGQKGGSQNVGSDIQQGMRNSNMQTGSTNVNVTTTDNSTKLNRQWYRDKVQENTV